MAKKGRVGSALRAITGMISEKRVMTYAAAADYHMVIALPPALMLLISLVRFFMTEEELLAIFSESLSEQAYSVIESVVSSVFQSSQATTVITFLLLLVSASGAMRSLMKGIYEVYGSQRKEPFLVFAGRAVLYTLALLVMIVASLVLLVYGSQLIGYLRDAAADQSLADAILSAVEKTRYLLWGLILTPLFMAFYHFLPAGKPKFKKQFPGAVFCAAAWTVFSWGYSLYVSVSGKFGAYGYVGTVMVIMMWMYYCLMFFLMGGCINVYLEKKDPLC